MKTSEFLKRAKSLIDSPEKWTQGVCARNIDGKEVSVHSPSAVCFCSEGAIHAATNQFNIKQRANKYAMLQSAVGSNLEVFEYNDSHTHAEVMLAWDKAISLAESEGD